MVYEVRINGKWGRWIGTLQEAVKAIEGKSSRIREVKYTDEEKEILRKKGN